MSRLRIELLGAFQATLDGESISTFGTDKVRALLAYLAVEAHRPHRREHLAGLLWSDQAEKKALHSLRQSLSTLRKAIKEDPSEAPFLLVNRDTIQFNPDSNYWLDIAAFREAFTQGLPQNQQGRISKRPNIQRLKQAFKIYQGNFLDQLILKDSPLFDEWAILQREILTRQVVEIMCFLVDYHECRSEFGQACQIAERIVKLLPWEESAHQIIMRMLAQGGRWSAVEVQYQSLLRYLDEELGVEPSPDTAALMEEIRQSAKGKSPLAPRNKIRPYKLPIQQTRFVGRETEILRLSDLIANSGCQLITLTGPGGSGKSRLALQVAYEQVGLYDDGVFFVPLATINSTDLLTTSIAQVIGFSFYTSQNPLGLLIDHLRTKDMLLVLDNFEQLLAASKNAAETISQILKNAPKLIILVTSRQPLNLMMEQILEIQGLTYPSPKQGLDLTKNLSSYSAIMLFEQIAKRGNPQFSWQNAPDPIIRICRLVEGLPLGVELSASWIRGYSVSEIANQIEQDLDFLSTSMGDIPDRHRSLRSVFNHSWELLTDEEKAIFRKLAVFQGGFSLEAATTITAAPPDQIFTLVDKSLLQRTAGERYQMQSLVQQFALEKLEENTDEYQETRNQHCTYYLTQIQKLEPNLPDGLSVKTINSAELEIENIRAAWQWVSAHHKVRELSQASRGLGRFYDMHSWFEEGRKVFAETAQFLQEIPNPADEVIRVLGNIITQQGWFESQLGNYQVAIASIESIMLPLRAQDFHLEMAAALNVLGSTVYELGEFDKAKDFFKESIHQAIECNCKSEVAFAKNYLGSIARVQGDFPQARQYFVDSLENYQQINDQWGIAKVLNNLGNMAGVSGDYTEAQEHFEQSLAIRRGLGDQAGIAGCLHNLSNIAYIAKDFQKTKQLRLECLAICKEIGFTWGIGTTLKHLGDVEKSVDNPSQAKKYYTESLELSEAVGDRRSAAFVLTSLGNLAHMQDEYSQALEYYKKALKISLEIEIIPLAIDILMGIAELRIKEERYQEAYDLIEFTKNHPKAEKQTQDKGKELETQLQDQLTKNEYQQIKANLEPITLEAFAETL